ncbi:hypothetical protein HK096_008267 [Nowakowskiella sp. JEL0078]|nr:hypothetical protein HK096_008267 [Nowakowskiella sp. JEL0078]
MTAETIPAKILRAGDPPLTSIHTIDLPPTLSLADLKQRLSHLLDPKAYHSIYIFHHPITASDARLQLLHTTPTTTPTSLFPASYLRTAESIVNLTATYPLHVLVHSMPILPLPASYPGILINPLASLHSTGSDLELQIRGSRERAKSFGSESKAQTQRSRTSTSFSESQRGEVRSRAGSVTYHPETVRKIGLFFNGVVVISLLLMVVFLVWIVVNRTRG